MLVYESAESRAKSYESDVPQPSGEPLEQLEAHNEEMERRVEDFSAR